jgi:DNA-binding beta-propeller fold protein YncE
VAVSPDGSLAYVAGGSGIAVINTATNTAIDTVAIDGTSTAVAVSPDGSHLYVTNRDNTVSVISFDSADNAPTVS